MAKEIGIVYEESDYSVFKPLLGNRIVDDAQENKIKESISKVGWIKNPIVVNEKMQVIDGQARLEVLKELGLPVQYVIAYGSGIDECISMNIGQSNWKVKDYVVSYAIRGNENYARLLELICCFDAYNIQEVAGAIKNTIIRHGYASYYLKSGDFEMSEDDYKETFSVLESCRDFLPILNKIPGSSRVKRTALIWVVKNTKVNVSRLYKRLSERYPEISPVVDTRPDIFLSELSDVYNKGLAARNCVYFDNEYKRFERESTQA